MVYPATLWSNGNNTDGTTAINAAYTNARDEELEAVEATLGQDLVLSEATVALSARIRVNNDDDLLLVPSAGRVGIATGTLDASSRVHVNQATAGQRGICVSMPIGAETTASGIRVTGYSPATGCSIARASRTGTSPSTTTTRMPLSSGRDTAQGKALHLRFESTRPPTVSASSAR